jgi:hypothetical protein
MAPYDHIICIRAKASCEDFKIGEAMASPYPIDREACVYIHSKLQCLIVVQSPSCCLPRFQDDSQAYQVKLFPSIFRLPIMPCLPESPIRRLMLVRRYA